MVTIAGSPARLGEWRVVQPGIVPLEVRVAVALPAVAVDARIRAVVPVGEGISTTVALPLAGLF